jgi:hypothetical protein
MSESQYTPQEPSGWALSGVVFAASMLTLIGLFQIVAGLVAIIDDDFFLVARNYTFDLDTSAWGWLHLLIGLLLVFTGYGLFSRQTWAGVTAMVLTAVENFFFIPYYPFWSILVIALSVWVMWALTRPGAIET